MEIPIEQHNIEIKENMDSWNKKPLLREIYNTFYKRILSFLNKNVEGEIVELGSGIGNFKSVYPQAVATDIFPNPWIDRVEDAYRLSSKDLGVSNLILFDVFHHLKYPGFALKEFHRALNKNGRVIIFDPGISLLGFLVYGIIHHEPVAWKNKIEWLPQEGEDPNKDYYAAQGNATRVFAKKSPWIAEIEKDWKILAIKKYADISYVLSGGFSKPSLYPKMFLPVLKIVDKILSFLPWIFATRILVVLEKR